MLLQVVCTHLNCTKKVHSFFFDEVRLGGVFFFWGGGGGGGGVHVSGGRGLHGVSEGGAG